MDAVIADQALDVFLLMPSSKVPVQVRFPGIFEAHSVEVGKDENALVIQYAGREIAFGSDSKTLERLEANPAL